MQGVDVTTTYTCGWCRTQVKREGDGFTALPTAWEVVKLIGYGPDAHLEVCVCGPCARGLRVSLTGNQRSEFGYDVERQWDEETARIRTVLDHYFDDGDTGREAAGDSLAMSIREIVGPS